MPDNFSALVINPDTGEIRNVNREQYAELGDEWKQTSPNIAQLQEAYGSDPFTGAINYGERTESGTFKSAIAPSVAVKNIPTTAEGNIDIDKSINKWGDNTSFVLQHAVSAADKPKVSQIVSDVQNRSQAQQTLKEYTDPFQALASGVSPDTVRQVYDIDTKGESGKSPFEQYNDLSKDSKQIIKSQGIEGFTKFQEAQQDKFKQDSAEYDKASANINKISEAKSGDNQYDLVKLLNKGVSKADIITVFGKDAYKDASESLKNVAGTVEAKNIIDKAGGVNKAIASNLSIKIFEKAGYDAGEIKQIRDAQKQIEAVGGVDKAIASNLSIKVFEKAGYDTKDIEKIRDTKKTLSPYAITKPVAGPFMNESDRPTVISGYDIESYANDKLSSGMTIAQIKQDLLDKNFNSEDVDKLTKNLQASKDAISSPEFKEIEKQYLKDGRINKQYEALEKAGIKTGWDSYEAMVQVSPRGVKNLKQFAPEPVEDIYNRLTESQKLNVLQNYDQWEGLPKEVAKAYAGYGKIMLPFVPVAGTIYLGETEGWKNGWTIASAVGDALILAGPIMKLGSIASPSMKSVSAAKNVEKMGQEIKLLTDQTDDFIKAVANTGRVSDEYVQASKVYTKDLSDYMEALNSIEANKLKLFDALNKTNPKNLASIKKSVDDFISTSLSTVGKAEVGTPVRDLVNIEKSNIKLIVSDLDKSITNAGNIAKRLEASSPELAKVIQESSTSTGGKFTQADKGTGKSLIKQGDIEAGKPLKGEFIKYADLGFSSPSVKESLLSALTQDPVLNAQQQYKGLLYYGQSTSNIEKELARLRNILKTRQLSEVDRQTILDQVKELESVRLEVKVRDLSGVTVKKTSDTAGKIQQRLAEVNDKIKQAHEGKLYTSEMTTDEQLKLLYTERDALMNEINETLTLGMEEIYKANVKNVKGAESIIAPTEKSTINFLISKKLIPELPGIKALPKSDTIIKQLSAAVDKADAKLLREAANDIASEAKQLPAGSEKTLLLKEAEYIKDNAEELAGMIKNALNTETATSLNNLKNELKVAELKYKSTKSPSIKTKLADFVEKTKQRVATIEADPMADLNKAMLTKLFADSEVVGKNLPVTVSSAELNVISVKQNLTAADIAKVNAITRANPDYVASVLPALSGGGVDIYRVLSPDNKVLLSHFLSPDIESDLLITPKRDRKNNPSAQTNPSIKPYKTSAPDIVASPDLSPAPQPQPQPQPETQSDTEKTYKNQTPSPDTSRNDDSMRLRAPLPPNNDAEILSVEGVPNKPGEVIWKQGIIWIDAKPPADPDDIKRGNRGKVQILIEAPEDAPVKTGTPKQTIFSRGEPPKSMRVRIGATVANTKGGKDITFSRFTGGGEYLTRRGGRVVKGMEKDIMRGGKRGKRKR